MGTDSHGKQPIYESGNSENKTNAEDGCTGPMARNGSVTRFVVWMVYKLNEMVLCLWRPARQAECRAPSLEGVRPQLLCKVVTLPLHLPEEGKKGQNVQLLVQKTNSLSISFNGMLKEYSIKNSSQGKARKRKDKYCLHTGNPLKS